jgi:hypothetical protein
MRSWQRWTGRHDEVQDDLNYENVISEESTVAVKKFKGNLQQKY